MSKTETQSEALTAERRLFITAVANLELRKKFGDEGFRLDLERDELEALIEMAEKVSRLDAENKALHQDAKRYRWLRRWKGQEHEPPFTVQHEIDGILWGGDLDAAIDAAQAAAKNGGAA